MTAIRSRRNLQPAVWFVVAALPPGICRRYYTIGIQIIAVGALRIARTWPFPRLATGSA